MNIFIIIGLFIVALIISAFIGYYIGLNSNKPDPDTVGRQSQWNYNDDDMPS